jgi:hemolysin activation/secretion protein
MKRVRGACARLGIALLVAIPILMDDAAAQVWRDRTGPDASSVTPEFIEPEASPLPAPAIPSPVSVSGTARIGSVHVDDAEAAPADTRRDWMPVPDPVTGLSLERAPTLDADWIAAQFAYNRMIGTAVPLDRIVALVQLINRAFVANGYINSGVLVAGSPPADGGSLELKLITGRLVQADDGLPVAVQWSGGGARGLSKRYVRARMPAARAQPLDAIAIERDFRLLTDDPAIRTVDADLQPGDRPGEARLTLVVDPQPRFDAYATMANNRSPSIGGERYALGGSIRNLLAAGDVLAVEVGLTGDRGDVFGAYETSLIAPPTRLLLRASYNQAAVIDPQLRPLGIEATDWSLEGGVSRTVYRRPLLPGSTPGRWHAARSLTLGLRLAHRDSRTYLLGEPFSFSPGSAKGHAHYTALRLTADWVQRSIDVVLAVSLTATQGIDGTRSVESDPLSPQLLSPDRDFRSVRADISFAHRISADGLELRTRFSGQWANGILYSGERFAVGGAQTVRGYRETLLLADTAVAGTIELAQPVHLGEERNGFAWGAFVVSGFVDGAWLHNREGPQPSPASIASIGAALAWTPSPAVTARVAYARALRHVVAAGRRDLQDRGVHFGVTFRPLEF